MPTALASKGEKSKMKNWILRGLLGIAILLSGMAEYLYATTLVSYTFEEAVTKAQDIFEGEVDSQYSELSEDGNTIYTYVTFSRLETIKGQNTEPTRTLRFEGGCVADDCILIPEMPSFDIGEKVILFVKGNIADSTICPLMEWSEGKFRVEVDPGSGSELIRNGRGEMILGFDEEKKELIAEIISEGELSVPVPVSGSPDRLVSPLPPDPSSPGLPILFSKDDFKTKIREIAERQSGGKETPPEVMP